jgi:DNA-binding transcriptional MerR regulator
MRAHAQRKGYSDYRVNEMRQSLSIGKLATETGVKVVTIRYYERIGILSAPARSAGNYRIYSEEHARTVRFVRRCRDLGFALDEIRDLLRLSSEEAPSCAEICAIADRHLGFIEKKVNDLKQLAGELRRINSSCNGNRPMSECRIIEALSDR